MRDRITNRLVAKIQPKDKPFEVSDVDLPGFLLRVQPSGMKTYYARYRLEDGKQNRVRLGPASVLTPAQARDMAKKKLAGATWGEDPAAARGEARAHTLRSFIEEVYGPWLRDNRKSGAAIAQALLSAFGGIGDKKLADITSWHVEKWRRGLTNKGRTEGTVNRYLTYLKALYTRAVEWDFVAEHPLKKVKQKREDTSRVRYLTDDEERRLMEALDAREERIRAERDSANAWRRERGYTEYLDLREVKYADHLKPMVLLSLNCGLRRGELFGLEWRDVVLDSENPTLTVRAELAKGGKTRHIPLNDTASGVLRAWQDQTPGNGLVFRSPKTGKRFDNCNKAWREVLAEAGIADFRWHDQRHDFASKLAMSGVNLYVIKELLGHSTIKLTERYAHLSPREKAEAVRQLDRRAQNNVVPLRETAQE